MKILAILLCLIATSAWAQVSNQQALSQVGATHVRTSAEITAGVTPTNYGYLPGNVRRYGADPTGSADSTAAFQAAINAIPSAGGTVYVPCSSFAGYKITAPLVIPSGSFYLRMTGAGFCAVISESGAAAFDLITWSNPGGSTVTVPYTQIDTLTLNGSNLTGAGNLINTRYVSGLRLNDLLLLNLPTTGSGINVTGNGATYSHEVVMRNIEVEGNTGLAMVNMTGTSSDSSIDGLVGNGNNGTQYCLNIATGSGNNYFNNLHAYGCSKNSLFVGAVTATQQITNSVFDTSVNDNVSLQGSAGVIFSNVKFEYAPVNFAALLLNNATGTRCTACVFDAGTVNSKYAVNETGTSNGNSFNQSTLMGTFATTPAVNLLGTESAWRVQGTDFMMSGAGSITAAGTIFIGTGASNASEATVQVPMAYAGVARKLVLICTNAPGAGQTFTATVRNNGTNTAIVATISGAASFFAVAGGFIQTALNDSLSISVVASAGAATSTVRATLVVNQ